MYIYIRIGFFYRFSEEPWKLYPRLVSLIVRQPSRVGTKYKPILPISYPYPDLSAPTSYQNPPPPKQHKIPPPQRDILSDFFKKKGTNCQPHCRSWEPAGGGGLQDVG